MWDGNPNRWNDPAYITSLSENQCGMETRQAATYKSGCRCVEREPMWDGNFVRVRKIDRRSSR